MRSAIVLPDLRPLSAANGCALPALHVWGLSESEFPHFARLRSRSFLQEVGEDVGLRKSAAFAARVRLVQ